MKITEITEGYSSTHEGWGEFKNAAGKGAGIAGRAASKAMGAVTGATGRQLRDIGNTAMAKMGSGKAQGSKEMQRVVGGVIKNFNRYLGQTKGKPTVATLKQYLIALGLKNPVMERRGVMPQAAQNLRNKLKTMPKSQAQQTAQSQTPTVPPQASGGREEAEVLNRNDLFDIIGKNIQQAMQTGTLPKELKKFLGQ